MFQTVTYSYSRTNITNYLPKRFCVKDEIQRLKKENNNNGIIKVNANELSIAGGCVPDPCNTLNTITFKVCVLGPEINKIMVNVLNIRINILIADAVIPGTICGITILWNSLNFVAPND